MKTDIQKGVGKNPRPKTQFPLLRELFKEDESYVRILQSGENMRLVQTFVEAVAKAARRPVCMCDFPEFFLTPERGKSWRWKLAAHTSPFIHMIGKNCQTCRSRFYIYDRARGEKVIQTMLQMLE